jgi:putative heme transporter
VRCLNSIDRDGRPASTAMGGLLGGIVGLILAVPATVIASNAIARLRSRGTLARVAERAEPTVRRILD